MNLVEPHQPYQNIKKDECLICLEILDGEIAESSCGHIYHYHCIVDWIKRKGTHRACCICAQNTEIINVINFNKSFDNFKNQQFDNLQNQQFDNLQNQQFDNFTNDNTSNNNLSPQIQHENYDNNITPQNNVRAQQNVRENTYILPENRNGNRKKYCCCQII